MVTKKAEEKWSAGIVEQVSLDMQNEFPHAKGFSTTNLWNMKKWFLFYSDDYKKLQQLVGEMDAIEINFKTGNILQNLKLQQVVGEIEFPKLLHLFRGDIIFKSLQNVNLSKKQRFTLKRLQRKDGAATP